jgi:hypothetical protein
MICLAEGWRLAAVRSMEMSKSLDASTIEGTSHRHNMLTGGAKQCKSIVYPLRGMSFLAPF